MEQKHISLGNVSVVALDEADRMLDVGFMPQIKRILATVPKERQTLLFSATMPKEISSLAATYMKLPLRIEVAPQGTAATRVEQEIFIISKSDKMRLLDYVLTEHKGQTVLIFSRTKHGAKKIARDIRFMGHTADEIHSNRSQNQRQKALDGFKKGKIRVLVATDIAARGIDVKDVSLVINFDLPDSTEDYVHRIGRTGRAGQSGKAISFATPSQKSDIRKIESLIRKTLPIMGLPELPAHRVKPPQEDSRKDFGGGRGRGPRSGGGGRSFGNRGGSGSGRGGSSTYRGGRSETRDGGGNARSSGGYGRRTASGGSTPKRTRSTDAPFSRPRGNGGQFNRRPTSV